MRRSLFPLFVVAALLAGCGSSESLSLPTPDVSLPQVESPVSPPADVQAQQFQQSLALPRRVTWDEAAIPVDQSLTGNAYNTVLAGGLTVSTGGTALRVSSNRFTDVDASYSGAFSPLSGTNLFAPLGSNEVDVTFQVPGTTTAATVTAFAAVFSSVQVAGATRIQFFAPDQTLLRSLEVPVADRGGSGHSFQGLRLTDGSVIARVRITLGQVALGSGVVDMGPGDVVVLDDLVYADPVAATAPLVFRGSGAAEVTAMANLFRAQAGTAVAEDPVTSAVLGPPITAYLASLVPVFPQTFDKPYLIPRLMAVGYTQAQATALVTQLLPADLGFLGGFNLRASQGEYQANFSPTAFLVPTAPQQRVFFRSSSGRATGFGVVLIDVDVAQATLVDVLDGNATVASVAAPIRSDASGLSFVGVISPSSFTEARLTLGNAAFTGVADGNGASSDQVGQDHFIVRHVP